MARAAVEMIATRVLEPHTGKKIDDEAKQELAELLSAGIDSVGSPSRTGLAWGMVGFLLCVLVVGALGATWQRINSIDSRIEARFAADAEYSQTLAHYLVIRAKTDNDNAANIDKLLRKIAAAQDVNTSDIPAPVTTPQPAALTRKHYKHLAAEAADGENK